MQLVKIALYFSIHKLVRLKNIWNKKRLLNISSDNEVIFIHVPKNAGTAFSKLLNISTSHITAKEVKDILGVQKMEEYFSFCILREPIDRFVSLYSYARMPISHYHDNISIVAWPKTMHLDYYKLKDKNINECVEMLEEGVLKHDASFNQWNPQTSWIYDDNNNILVDHIALQSDLPSLVKLLEEKTNLIGNLEIVNQSSSDLISMRKELSEQSIRILNRIYKSDIKLYNSLFNR